MNEARQHKKSGRSRVRSLCWKNPPSYPFCFVSFEWAINIILASLTLGTLLFVVLHELSSEARHRRQPSQPGFKSLTGWCCLALSLWPITRCSDARCSCFSPTTGIIVLGLLLRRGWSQLVAAPQPRWNPRDDPRSRGRGAGGRGGFEDDDWIPGRRGMSIVETRTCARVSAFFFHFFFSRRKILSVCSFIIRT